MAAPLWWATLRKDSPRYATWHEIFGSNDVPLKSPASFEAALGYPVAETARCYELDLEAMVGPRRARLVTWIAAKFEVSRNEAMAQILESGFPIREADVRVAFSLRAFI